MMPWQMFQSVRRQRVCSAVIFAVFAATGPAVAELKPFVFPGEQTTGPEFAWQDIRLYADYSNPKETRVNMALNGKITNLSRDNVTAYRIAFDQPFVEPNSQQHQTRWNAATNSSSARVQINQNQQRENKDGSISVSLTSLELKDDLSLPDQITGHIDLLEAAVFETHDLPLEQGARVELEPGVHLLLKQYSKAGSSHQCEFELQWPDPQKHRPHQFGMMPFVWMIIPVDAQGRSLRSSHQVSYGDNNAISGRFYAYNNQKIDKLHIRWVKQTRERRMAFEIDDALLRFPPAPKLVAGPVEIPQPDASIGRAKLNDLNAQFQNRVTELSRQHEPSYNLSANITLKLNEKIEFVSYRMPRLINVIDERGRNVLALSNGRGEQMIQGSRMNQRSELRFGPISCQRGQLVRMPKQILRITGDIALVIARQSKVERLDEQTNKVIDMPDSGTIGLIDIKSEGDDDTRVTLNYKGSYVYFEPQADLPFVYEVCVVKKDDEQSVKGRRRSWSRGGNDGELHGNWTFAFNDLRPEQVSHVELHIVYDTETVVLPFERDYTSDPDDTHE